MGRCISDSMLLVAGLQVGKNRNTKIYKTEKTADIKNDYQKQTNILRKKTRTKTVAIKILEIFGSIETSSIERKRGSRMWDCRRKSRIRGYGKHSLCLVLRRDARRWVWRCEDSCGKERGKGLHIRMTASFLERRAQIRSRKEFPG